MLAARQNPLAAVMTNRDTDTMIQHYTLERRAYLFLSAPALVLALAGCNPASGGETGTGSSTDTSGTDTDPGTSNPTTVDPTTQGPTSTPTTSESATGSTSDPTTQGTTTEPATGTDTDTGTGTDTSTSTGEPAIEVATVWATVNPALLATDAIVGLTAELDAQTANHLVVGDVVSIQSVAINPGGDAAITYDAPNGTGGVMYKVNFADNPVNGPFGLGDRLIVGPATGLLTPKGVEFGPDSTILVADPGAAAIKAFNIGDEGDIAPSFEITDLGSSPGIWDVHYIGGDVDVLLAAGTNGEVQVYEDFALSQGQAGPDRTIIPFDAGAQVSVNLHGITVVAGNLFLSDVGDPMDATDGQLFRITDLANADGEVQVAQLLAGGDLGNPVDLEVRDANPDTLWVVEKSNDKLLRFRPPMNNNPDFAFVDSFDVVKPESVALATNGRLIVASNPTGIDTDTMLEIEVPLMGAPTIGATIDRIGSITSVQSLVLADSGDALVTFDGPPPSNGGGAFAVPGLVGLAADDPVDAIGSRIWGPATGVVAPKGAALNLAQDRLFVADVGDSTIKVFDAASFGDTAPLFVITDLGGGAVWDIAYDDASDLLFAAGIDGTVRVFEGALVDMGASGPTRTITPTDDQDAVLGVNLHGIVYDALTKTLILSDVGDPMLDTDGAIFLIANADAADGNTPVAASIAGDQTHLGNPVDIAYFAPNLYVAEKAQSRVMRYNDILGFTGANNQAEDLSIDVPNPESVQLELTKP